MTPEGLMGSPDLFSPISDCHQFSLFHFVTSNSLLRSSDPTKLRHDGIAGSPRCHLPLSLPSSPSPGGSSSTTSLQSRSKRPDNFNLLIRNLDFFGLLVSLPIAFLTHLFIFLSVPCSHNPVYRFSFLLYSSSIFSFWVLIILVLVKYLFLHDNAWLVCDGYLFVFAGVCFSVEYWMIDRGMGGLAGEVYAFLRWVSLVCCGGCLVLWVKPSAFFVEYGLCCGLMVKGTWGLQVGLSMETDGGWFVWKCCERVGVVGVGELDVGLKCGVEQDGLRGLTLMRLLFVWHVIRVLVCSPALFWVLSMKGSSQLGDARGPLLLPRSATDGAGVRSMEEFELA